MGPSDSAILFPVMVSLACFECEQMTWVDQQITNQKQLTFWSEDIRLVY